MRRANGKRTCDFCAKPATGKQELDFTGEPGVPWGTDFQPIRMDFCDDCRDQGVRLIRSGNDRVLIA